MTDAMQEVLNNFTLEQLKAEVARREKSLEQKCTVIKYTNYIIHEVLNNETRMILYGVLDESYRQMFMEKVVSFNATI